MVRNSLLLNLLVIQRVESLVDDGYVLTYKATLLDGTDFFCLRHGNGNRITLTVNVRKNRMVQLTNGQLTYNGEITA